jgi:hypothetical protein
VVDQIMTGHWHASVRFDRTRHSVSTRVKPWLNTDLLAASVTSAGLARFARIISRCKLKSSQ